MLKKNAISLAVAASIAMTGAVQAGDLILDLNGKVPTFATHIFGGPNSDTGTGNDSSGQAVYSPDLIYVVGTPGANMGNAAGTVEIRFNLGNGAVFADNITDDHFILQRVGGGASFANDNSADPVFTILNGGQAGDFDVTVRLDNSHTLLDSGANVTAPAGLANGDTVRLALSTGAVDGIAAGVYTQDTASRIQYTNVSLLGVAGSTVEASVSIQAGEDATNEVVIANSAQPLVISGSANGTGTSAGGGTGTTNSNSINMANGETDFSQGAVAGDSDGSIDLVNAQNDNVMGSLTFGVAISNQFYVTAGGTTATSQISDPAGDQYAPDGADDVTLTVATTVVGGLGSFAVRVDGANAGCPAANTTSNSNNGDAAVLNYENFVNGVARNICARATAGVIAAQSFNASVAYENFEPTYQDQSYTATLGAFSVLNGCIATFPNVTNSNATGDATFLRINNATNDAARVRVTVYDQAGNIVGTSLAVLEGGTGIPAHGTNIYTPENVQAAIGATWTGRARVVARVGAQNCAGQNLIRSSGGILTNMTTTTDSNVPNAGVGSAITNSGN